MKKLLISLTLGLTLIGSSVIAAEDPTTSPVPTGDTSVSTTSASVADSTATTQMTTTTAPDGEATSPAVTTSAPDAGLTPDSPFYFIDKLLEKIQLTLASEAKKAQLLEEFGQERLSEAQKVTETTVKSDLLNEYIATIETVKEYIDKQAIAENDPELINSVKLGSTRGLSVLKELAATNLNPGLQNAIDKQETKLAEHLIFAELKQQFKLNNQAIEALEKQIAASKAAGQDVLQLENQLKELQAKSVLLKDSKKLIKGLQNELKHQRKMNEQEFEKFIVNDMEKYEEPEEDELKIEGENEDKAVDLQKHIQKEELKKVKKEVRVERKAIKEQVKKERKEIKEQEKSEKKHNKE